MQDTPAKLTVSGLAIGFGALPIQQDISFAVATGSIFAIMGDSGCGKSTLLRTVVGLLPPLKGSFQIDQEDYWAASEARRIAIGRRFGILFQGAALWSSLSTGENVGLPLRMLTQLDDDAIAALIQLKLSLVGLEDAIDVMPESLSGGMRKRAGLARALALDPELLFFDEPSAGLDPIASKRLDDLILELRDGFGVTVVMVSHELPSLLSICDDGIFLDSTAGTAIAHGSPRDLRDHCRNPEVHAFMNRQDPAERLPDKAGRR